MNVFPNSLLITHLLQVIQYGAHLIWSDELRAHLIRISQLLPILLSLVVPGKSLGKHFMGVDECGDLLNLIFFNVFRINTLFVLLHLNRIYVPFIGAQLL